MSDAATRRPRYRRYVGYIAGALLLLAVVLAVGSWLAIRTWGPLLARERLEAALAAALGRPARVERVALEPWRGRLVVQGVTVPAQPGEPGPHLVTLARAEAYVGVSSVWRRRLVLRSIRLEDFDLRLVAGAGDAAVPALPILPDVVRVGPVDVELGALELRRGRLLYDDPARATRVQAQGLAATARPGRGAMSVTLAADDITVDAPRGRERVERLEAQIHVAPTRLEVRRLAGTWEKGRLTVAGSLGAPFDEPRVDLTARGEIDLTAVARRAGSPWPLAGSARASARIEGTPRQPRVTAELVSPELTAGPVTARAVAARLALADGVLSVTQLSARAFDGSVNGSVTLELARPDRAAVTLGLRDVSSAALEALTGRHTGITGRLDADVDSRGDFRDPVRARSHVRLRARNVRLPDRLASLGAGTIDAEASADRGAFELARGIATWPALRLEANGPATPAGPTGLRVTAIGDLGQLAPLLGQDRMAGEATLAGQLGGRWQDPRLAGRLEVREPALADVRADHAVVPFELTQRSLRLETASLRLGRARLAATGTLTWPAAAPPAPPSAEAVRLDLRAHTEDARLEDAAPWLPPVLHGSGPVRVTATIEGTLAAWRLTGNAESASLRWPSWPAVSDVSVAFEATPERLEVPALRAAVLDAPLTARGRWRWAGTGEVEADAGFVDLARLPGLPEGLRVEGRARARLSATVRDGRAAGSGRIVGERVAVAGLALGRGTADVSVDGPAVRGEAAFPDARLSATAQGRLDGAAIIATQLTAKDIEIDPLVRQFRPDLAGAVTGRFSAVAMLDVPAREPRAARGTVRLEPVQLETAGERWQGRGPILFRREPGRLTLERFELAGRLGTATGSGRIDDGGTLEGTLRGQVPLALLAVLRPEVREASGRLDADVRLGGTLEKPIVLGRGTIGGGLLALRGMPVAIRDMEGRLALAPGRVRVEEIRASLGAGTVRATGEIALDGRALGAYQIEITGRGLGLTALEGLETVWNADATLVGRGARGLVRGEARLVRGLYTRDLSILPLLLEQGPREQPLEWGREIALQVGVRLDDNLVVRTRQAQLRAGGSLLLQGTLADPAILGTIETQEGRITFRRHRFVLENAVVRFDDPRRINPFLDVRATTRIRTYDVTMSLTGRPEDLAIRLTSEPPMPQEDLLALVTLGATRAELGRSGGTIFAGEAAQLLSRELLGLEAGASFVDVLEFGPTEGGDSQVRVGKRLDERTMVIYSGSFSEGGKQKLRIEYQLFGPLLMAGEQDFTGGFGGDLILRLRFR